LYNSFDQTKQKSWRYDGSFGDKDSGFAAEYSGQKSNTGDNEFYIKFSVKEGNATSYHTIRKGTDSYYLFSGVDSMDEIIKTIPGAKMPDELTMTILRSINNHWIKVGSDNDKAVQTLVPCSAAQMTLPSQQQLKELTGDKLPLKITGGPYSANDGTQSRVFEVGLKSDWDKGAYQQSVVGYLNCLDSLRGNDFKLRKVNSQDIDAFRLNITIDPLSNTVTQMQYKAFDQYFQVKIRDYNKDVTVNAPNDAVTLSSFIAGLDEPTKAALLLKTPIGSL
jgi:hypothetical protein